MPVVPLSLLTTYSVFWSGRHRHAVRLARVGDDAVDRAVGVDAVDRLHRLVDRLVPEVARVAEVDAALLVDGDVVGRVERLALEQPGDDVALAGLHVGLGDAAAAEVGPLGREQVAVGVELEAVGHAARASGRSVVLPVFGSNFQMCPASIGCFVSLRDVRERDVAEVDHAVRARPRRLR